MFLLTALELTWALVGSCKLSLGASFIILGAFCAVLLLQSAATVLLLGSGALRGGTCLYILMEEYCILDLESLGGATVNRVGVISGRLLVF